MEKAGGSVTFVATEASVTELPDETVNYVASIAPRLGPDTLLTGPLAAYATGGRVAVASARDRAYAGGGIVSAAYAAPADPSDRAFDGGGLVSAGAPTGSYTGAAPAYVPPPAPSPAYAPPPAYVAPRQVSRGGMPQRPFVLLGSSERLTEGPFHAITQSLMSLGACALMDLTREPKADLHGFELPGASSGGRSSTTEPNAPSRSSQPPSATDALAPGGSAEGVVKDKPADPMQFVAQLHQTCMQAFGNSDALKFEFLEEKGPDRKFLLCYFFKW